MTTDDAAADRSAVLDALARAIPQWSTSVAGTILDYSSFLTEMSNWTCVGHFI
jgi:hypothetical protein